MSGINPIGGAGGGFDPDLRRPKTPEDRKAEVDKQKKKWAAIRQEIENRAAATDDAIRKRVNLPHQGNNIDIDC